MFIVEKVCSMHNKIECSVVARDNYYGYMAFARGNKIAIPLYKWLINHLQIQVK